VVSCAAGKSPSGLKLQKRFLGKQHVIDQYTQGRLAGPESLRRVAGRQNYFALHGKIEPRWPAVSRFRRTRLEVRVRDSPIPVSYPPVFPMQRGDRQGTSSWLRPSTVLVSEIVRHPGRAFGGDRGRQTTSILRKGFLRDHVLAAY